MKNIEIYNTLNIDKDSSSIVATFTQEDDAVMEFKLFKDGQEIVLKDQTISLGAERKDGAVIEQEDGFLIKENNVLNITLKKNIIQVVGVVKIQLYLKDKSGEMASNTFNIRVNKKLLGAENVEATNDIKSLNTLVLELKNNTNKLIDDTKSKADKLLNDLQETGDNLSSTVKAKTDKIIEDTKAEVNNIKKDYEGLKKVVIDENIGIKLQKDVTELQNGLKSNQSLAYTGSSISAENTLEGRTEGMKITGRTLYNIQRKQVYSLGTNLSSDCYTSKQSDNLIDITLNKIEDGKYYFINIGGIDFKLLKPNTKYTVLCEEVTNGLSIQIMSTGYNNQLSDVGTFKNNKTTITTNDLSIGDKGQILYIMFPYNKLGNYKVRNLMLVEGEIDCIGNYFEGLKSFGEAEQEGDKYKISILSNGKNLTNFENPIVDMNGTTHKLLDNGIKVTSSSDNHQMWCFSMLRVNVKENTDYYCSFKYKTMEEGVGWIAIRTTNDVLIKDFGLHEGVFNSGHNKEVVVQFYASLGTPIINNTVEYYDFQIEEGTQATQYEPYIEDKKDILIKEPLRSIGDISDVMYEENGKVKIDRIIKKYVIDGNEYLIRFPNWDDEKTITFFFSFTNINNLYPKLICDKFRVITRNEAINGGIEGIIVTGAQNEITLKINKNSLSSLDIEGAKEYLKLNNISFLYATNETTTEVVENCVDIDLDTFQDKTYFNILNSMPGTLDFKIPSNLASIVQSHTKDIKIIYDLIDRLLIPNLIENKSDLALLSLK